MAKNKKEEKICLEEKEIKRLKNELKSLLDLFNSINDAIVFINKERKIVRVNEALCRIGGYEEKEIVGHKIKDLALKGMISPKSLPKIMKGLAKRFLGEETSPYEVVMKKKNGEEINVEIHASPLVKEGEVVGTVAVLRDTSERKNFEEILKKKNEDLERLNQAMIGRELKMIELKERIKELEKKIEE